MTPRIGLGLLCLYSCCGLTVFVFFFCSMHSFVHQNKNFVMNGDSPVTLSPENILNLSKDTITLMRCEWGICIMVLNSWNSLLKVNLGASLSITKITVIFSIKSSIVKNHRGHRYYSHLKFHCSVYPENTHVAKEGTYQCCLPKCAFPYHVSINALQTHIELSHMSRIPSLCPIQGLHITTLILHFGLYSHMYRLLNSLWAS
jgi:hypothetical protein